MREASNRVYLHVGTPKTGTTSIQELLWQQRDVAASAGLLYPGYIQAAHFHAAVDLQRERYRDWIEPLVDGAWDRLVEHVRSWPGTSVISCELLASATPQQAARALSSLSFAEVHVVCTARDLGRQIPSVWQENVKTGQTTSYPDFLTALRTGDPFETSQLFWDYQDIPQVLRTWTDPLPAERVHVVTMPRGGAAPDVLWQRFASVVGIDPGSLAVPPPNNTSLGMAEAELLRRLNLSLGGRLEWPSYAEVVKEQLATRILAERPDATKIVLPAVDHSWVLQRAQRLIGDIRDAGYHVVGDLDELLPAEPVESSNSAAPSPTDRELFEAALHSLTELVERKPDRSLVIPRARVRDTLRVLSEQHPPLGALRQLYWKRKASLTWARPAARRRS